MTLQSIETRTLGRYPSKQSLEKAQKGFADSYVGVGFGGAFGVGGVGRNQDIAPTKYGAASAYRMVPPINRAVNLRADAHESLPWKIVRNPGNDPANDVVVARSTDNHPDHPFALALSRLRRRQKASLFWLMEYADLVFGEIFIEYLHNEVKVGGLNWLNPLAVYIETRGGVITRFLYSDLNGEAYIPLLPNEVAYDRTLNPFDDHRGLSRVNVAVDKINVYRNTNRFVEAFFRNNAQPGGTVSPPDSETAWTDRERDIIKNEFRANMQGSDNAFSWLVAPRSLKIDSFTPPNIKEQYDINDPVMREIYTEFGVPIAMAGDTNGSSYQNQDATLTWFYQNTVIPAARKRQFFVNTDLLPYFDPYGDSRFEFDTTAFDLVSADDEIRSRVGKDNYISGLWTLNEARTYTKKPPVPEGEERLKPTSARPNLFSDTGVNADGTPQPSEPNGTTQQTQAANAVVQAKNPTLSKVGEQKLLPANVIEGKATQTTPEDELRAWQKKSTKSWKAAFEPIKLRGDLGDWIAEQIAASNGDVEAVKAVFAQARERLATKAIAATQLEFEMEFGDLLARVQNDKTDRRTFSASLRYLLNKFGKQSYLDGLKDGGVDTDELDDEDRGKIAEMLADQSQYVSELGSVLFKGDGITDVEAANKPTLWWNKSVLPMYQAGLISADKNSLYEWVYGDAEHCETCKTLNGQRHRLRDYQRKGLLPKSSELDCQGFNCKCNLVKATGKAKGNWV